MILFVVVVLVCLCCVWCMHSMCLKHGVVFGPIMTHDPILTRVIYSYFRCFLTGGVSLRLAVLLRSLRHASGDASPG